MSTDVKAAVDAAFRDEWGRVVATLIRTTGDWDLAEECAQDAFAMALQRWPKDGIPGRPGAWLTTAARNRAIDVLRRKAVGAAKLREVAAMSLPPDPPAYEGETDHSGVPDDRLRLMFTCCHPALSLEARVALTLRTLAGLTTAEIARAFLASEPTMAKRLVRAKQKIQHAGIPYRVPPAHLLPERTPGVLGVLYLLFNEGYSATAGADLVRQNLSAEAIRLARVLARLMPDEPEAGGLLALMLLHDARAWRAAGRFWRPGDSGGPGPFVVGRRRDQRGCRYFGGGAAVRAAGSVPDPGGHRRLPRDRAHRGSHRLAADRRPVRAARCVPAHAGGGAEPRGRGGDGPRAFGRAWRWSRRWRRRASWPATTCSPRPGPTSCAASAVPRRPPPRTPKRSSWRAPTPSAATSAAGWPKPRPDMIT